MIQFSRTQKQFIDNGAAKRNRLQRLARKAANLSINSDTRHMYIYSPAGLGKTHSVKQAMTESGIPHYEISGSQSMFAFGIGLATIQFLNQGAQKIVMVVDDCDEILKNSTNVNIMKNVLAGANKYSYEKSLQNQMSGLTDIQVAALDHFSSPEKMGFEVPTHNMVFVFTSNFKLPTDDAWEVEKQKGSNKAIMYGHLNAIRSRCHTSDFELESNEKWGWIADCVLNEDVVNLTDEDKIILLDWMFNNWDRLRERSIRTVQKMSETMIEDPTGYRDDWEIDYLDY